MFQAPTHLTNARRLFDCVSSIVYSFSYCHTVLNADRRVHVAKCVRLFPHTRFYILSHLRISFICFLSFLFFYSTFPLSHVYAHLFDCPQLYSCAQFIWRDFLCFSFHSSRSSRNVRPLTTYIPLYSPRVVAIMLILSPLGWCHL